MAAAEEAVNSFNILDTSVRLSSPSMAWALSGSIVTAPGRERGAMDPTSRFTSRSHSSTATQTFPALTTALVKATAPPPLKGSDRGNKDMPGCSTTPSSRDLRHRGVAWLLVLPSSESTLTDARLVIAPPPPSFSPLPPKSSPKSVDTPPPPTPPSPAPPAPPPPSVNRLVFMDSLSMSFCRCFSSEIWIKAFSMSTVHLRS
mmetsp:Transcript_31911/g.58018  ORF Transcript_31911/g.58018 Transcript_31911/m.58018 type:complete len:202 (+) Transcript_31911:401-1006(+)